jgi:galactonate dehydratase
LACPSTPSWEESSATSSPCMPGLAVTGLAMCPHRRKPLHPTPKSHLTDTLGLSKKRKEQGFKAIKMNATEDLGWLDSPSVLQASVERLAAVKAEGLDAGLDFHGRVHKPMAKQLAKLLEPHQPLFIEEPLLSEHPEAIKHFSQQTTIPIALGERLYNRWDVKPFLESSSIDILQPDVSHCGGISEIRRIAAMCEAYDVGIGTCIVG